MDHIGGKAGGLGAVRASGAIGVSRTARVFGSAGISGILCVAGVLHTGSLGAVELVG